MAFSLLSVGARAMSANYAALQTASNNIANANVEGYSRQQVNLRTTAGQPLGSGFVGSGVSVGSITRVHDAFLTREAATANAQAAFDGTRLGLLSQLESAFATGDEGVGAAASNLFTALADLASAPGDTSARQAVLSRAGELAQRFSSAGQHLDALQSNVVSELRTSVDSINGLTSSLAQLNDEIVRQQGLGQPSNELLDQRDQLVHQLSGFVQVTTLASADGALSVFAAGGQRLVLGGEAQKLEVAADDADGSRATVALREADGSVRQLDSGLLQGGGSVGALLRFQNDDLVAARNTLGQMALAMAARTNLQQSRGLDLGSPPGAGEPIFTDFVAQSLAGGLKGLVDARNSDPSGAAEIRISDPSLLEADEYVLEMQPDTSYVMTRSSDGKRFLSADGSSFTHDTGAPPPAFKPGFTLNLTGVIAPGDRFLLQPVGQAASQIQRVLADPKGLAAAAPATVTAAATNTGTGAVSALTITSDAAAVQAKMPGRLTFTDDAGAYTWTQLDANDNPTGAPQSGTWTSSQTVQLAPDFELKFTGLPKSGDTFELKATQYPGSNNGNAKALAALGSEAFVGGSTLINAYAGALASVGTRVQSAQTASDISSSVATEALVRRDAQSGVDLDEEGAKLIAYQKSYQAAAKVLQVAQSVFDTLLEATSGR